VANSVQMPAPGTRVARSAPVPIRARPLRICQVIPYDITEHGGVKHHAFQLARELRARGDHVTIIGPASRPHFEPNVVSFLGATNIPANGSDNRLGLFVSPRQVRDFSRRHEFDVVHVHEPQLPLLPYWAVRFSPGAAHVGTFHAYWERPRHALTLLSRLFAAVQSPAFQRCVAVSEEAAAFARLSWRRPLGVVPNGVPIDAFTPPLGERRPGPLRLLFVGRIGDRRKGFEELYRAFARLRASGHEFSLDVIGELGGAQPPAPLPGLTYHGPVPMRELVQHYPPC